MLGVIVIVVVILLNSELLIFIFFRYGFRFEGIDTVFFDFLVLFFCVSIDFRLERRYCLIVCLYVSCYCYLFGVIWGM